MAKDFAYKIYSNPVVKLVSDMFFVAFIAGIIYFAMIVILKLKNIFWGIFTAASALWCGATLSFVPIKFIEYYDLPSKLVIEKSPFKVLLDGIVYAITDEAVAWSTVIFVSATVLLLISIIMIACNFCFKTKTSDITEISNEKN